MRAGLMAVLAVVAGCEELSVCERAAAHTPLVEIGIGEAFDGAIVEGDALAPDWGNQGGRHLSIAVRTEGINPGQRRAIGADADVPGFDVQLVGVDDGIVYAELSSEAFAMAGDENGATLALGRLVLPFWDAQDAPAQAYLLQVVAADACGAVATDERLITLSL